MPRILKRRSDAISRDDASPDPTPGPSQAPRNNNSNNNTRRRRQSSTSSDSETSGSDSEADIDAADTQVAIQHANLHILTKKLVRLALASEYARIPLRRTDIIQKIFKESNAPTRQFKQVFNDAQNHLAKILGMQLIELPIRERTTLKDRRTQATQQASLNSNNNNGKSQSTRTSSSSSSANNKSWILTSILPTSYKTHPTIAQPSLAPSKETESTYTALYTFILALVYLNNSSLSEAKMERYLKRVNADTYTPLGNLEKLLTRMAKEGYIEKRRDTTSGEEVVEYVPGPRGKVEVGIAGVAGLVRAVYGFGSIGVDGKLHIDGVHGPTNANGNGNEDGNEGEGQEEEEEEEEAAGSSSTGRVVKIDRDDLEQRLKRTLGDGAVVA